MREAGGQAPVVPERKGGGSGGGEPQDGEPGGRDGARQLALPFAHRPRFARADLLTGACNESALAWLSPGNARSWPQRRLALWGEAGSGKTHLLHVWAAEHEALLLPGTALRGVVAGARPSRPRRWRAVAVDDADAATDEAALLHLLNASQETGLPVLLGARAAPARWTIALPDLASRLRATHSVPIGRPDEPMLRRLLLRLLAERQLAVAPAVLDWVLARLPRTAQAMREAARALDEASLASGGRVTRALAAVVLERPPFCCAGEADAGEGEADGRLI